METWITYVIAPIAIAIVSWVLGQNGRRIDETTKLVALLQDEIDKLNSKVDKLETRVEEKEVESESKSMIIQEAFRCRMPSAKCPVLNKLSQYNEQRFEKQKPGEYPPQQDDLQGGDCECGSGI